MFVFGVTVVGDGHGTVDGFVLTGEFFVASLVGEFAADVADPGILPEGFAAAGVLAVVEVVELCTAGHGAFTFGLLVVVAVVPAPFVVEVAEAGGVDCGFVADVADAGVDPTLLLVPRFCCVAGVAELDVLPAVGAMPGFGVIP